MNNITQVNWRPAGDSAPVSTTVASPIEKPGDVVYLYFDESGNLDFTQNGSPFFIMTCAAVQRPFITVHILDEIKYNLIEGGDDIEKLHACEDRNEVRKLVYQVLAMEPNEYRVYSAYVKKASIPDEMRTPDEIYSRLYSLIFDEVFALEIDQSVKQVIAITDRLPVDAKRRSVERPLKKYMKGKFQDNGIPYRLLHHDSVSDMNLQATDYFCWAAHRDLTKGKQWPMVSVMRSFVEVGEVTFDERKDDDPPNGGPSSDPTTYSAPQ